MRSKTSIAAASIAALALALPATSQARHGADDGPNHERHASGGVHHRHDGRDDRRTAAERARRSERHHRHGAHHERGDDHGRRHGGHGSDD
jgi:hypothetical protein